MASKHYDLLVIGAGIYGASIARDAALRGCSVAIVEQGDYCSQTSHNSLKIMHGGIRYLQHLDLRRTLESIHEQDIWLHIAPHLVHPMPCIMPTYGHGLRGPLAMWGGIKLFETLGFGRAKRIGNSKTIPKGGILSKQQCLQRLPNIDKTDLTGAALWYDAQAVDTDRVVLEKLMSAEAAGADAANYARVESLLCSGDRLHGARVRDLIDETDHEITAKIIINAAGPWAEQIIGMAEVSAEERGVGVPLTQSMNIVTRKVFGDEAVALTSRRVSDSVLGATKRLYFFTPWRGCSAIGTTHFDYEGNPDALSIGEREIQAFLDEINHVYKGLDLGLEDVSYCYKGLTPGADDGDDGSRAHRGKIIDHEAVGGSRGLISVIGVKYTTARLEAERAVDLLMSKLGKEGACQTAIQTLPGAGSVYPDCSQMNGEEFSDYCRALITETSPLKLADLLLRRIDLTARGLLDTGRLRRALQAMISHHGWDEGRIRSELETMQHCWLTADTKQSLREYLKKPIDELFQA